MNLIPVGSRACTVLEHLDGITKFIYEEEKPPQGDLKESSKYFSIVRELSKLKTAIIGNEVLEPTPLRMAILDIGYLFSNQQRAVPPNEFSPSAPPCSLIEAIQFKKVYYKKANPLQQRERVSEEEPLDEKISRKRESSNVFANPREGKHPRLNPELVEPVEIKEVTASFSAIELGETGSFSAMDVEEPE